MDAHVAGEISSGGELPEILHPSRCNLRTHVVDARDGRVGRKTPEDLTHEVEDHLARPPRLVHGGLGQPIGLGDFVNEFGTRASPAVDGLLGVGHDDYSVFIEVSGQQFTGKRLKSPPLLQRSVLKLVEQEVPDPLVESVAHVVSVPSRVESAQEIGKVVESVCTYAALGPVERGFQEFCQPTQCANLATELGSEIDSSQPDRLTKELDELRRDGLAAERVLLRKDLGADTASEHGIPVEPRHGLGGGESGGNPAFYGISSLGRGDLELE